MSEIPPPPPVPLAPELEPDSEPPPPSERDLPKNRLFANLKRWGAIVGAIAGLFSAAGSVWKVIDSLNDLRDTIRDNEEGLENLQEEIKDHHLEMETRVNSLTSAVRAQRNQDQQVITNLRIAVAAMQAAEDVREGRTAYTGLEDLMDFEVEEPAPRSWSERRTQAASASGDAQAALDRALKIERATEDVDLLAGL